ncbi:uncharacterized protein H6S33_009043 [Morchella sextelata]|uniref:uncharacterized protein n=1 Tax=Morchella sextelata TaxID=1174677 RepID=UPI001D050718|nr:uncharacterized protein H6S33_009043 [Morchella sextelata]KAH0612663.1 hypothetical protein H6S33_009043 [Morchella sextelata]
MPPRLPLPLRLPPAHTLRCPLPQRRLLTVLAIETSCDDTSIALLTSPTPHTATLLAHETVTSPNRIYGGIHPLISTVSHATHLAPLLAAVVALGHKPDFVAVTRGPGMPTSLSIGLDTAKGLAVAWGVPLVGVHHMLAHALTPRLVAALNCAAVERAAAAAAAAAAEGGAGGVPEGSEVVAESHGAAIESSEAAPESTQAALEISGAAPESIKASPESIKAASESIKAASESIKAASESIKAASESIKAASESIKAASESIKAASESIKAASESIKAASESSDTSPSPTQAPPPSPSPTAPNPPLEPLLEITTPVKKSQILQQPAQTPTEAPQFPFLTLLVSGGHTQVVHSRSLTSHKVLADTMDIALGDMIDKCARQLVPARVLTTYGESVAYGAALEEFCFPARDGSDRRYGYRYTLPGGKARAAEDEAETAAYDWQLSAPLAKTGPAMRRLAYSFSGLGSSVERCLKRRKRLLGGVEIGDEERRALGRKVMVLAFEHVAARMVLGLEAMGEEGGSVGTVVVSGGVAANRFFRHVLRIYLTSKGYQHIKIVVPPMKFCTDNAAMIAWAGLELYRAGWQTGLSALPLKKWSMDDDVYIEGEEDNAEHGVGGVLGAQQWIKRDVEEEP